MAHWHSVNIVDNEDAPRSFGDLKPEHSQTSLLLAPPAAREASIMPSESSQTTLVVRTTSPTSLSITAVVGDSSPIERKVIRAGPKYPVAVVESIVVTDFEMVVSPMTVTYGTTTEPPSPSPQGVSQTPTIVEPEATSEGRLLAHPTMQIVLRQEGPNTAPLSSSTTNLQQWPTSSSTPSIPSIQRSKLTPSERVDYDRYRKVFYRQPATRIPIPTAWRSSPRRAYIFRGPSSPFRDVATTPIASLKKDLVSVRRVFATEPWRSTPSPQSTTSTADAASTLQAIAARPAVRFVTPAATSSEVSEGELLDSSSHPAELPGSEVPPSLIPSRHPGRKQWSSLPVPRGKFETEIFADTPRKRRRVSAQEGPSTTASAKAQSAFPVRSPVNSLVRQRSAKTIPQDHSSRAISKTSETTTHATSRIPTKTARPSRVRFLGPVTLEERSVSTTESEASASSIAPASTPAPAPETREEMIARRISAIRERVSTTEPQARTDNRASVLSHDQQWFEASDVAVLDEPLR
jgi:hypothetical protein